MRIPASPVNDGATVLDCPQYLERGFFVDAGGADWSFRRPGAPFRLSKSPALPPRPAPRMGSRASGADELIGVQRRRDGSAEPFADIKVLDLTTFWAGAYLTCYLGAFGAEIVKVESIQRPDGFRYSGAWAHEGDRWYERGGLWQATNLNKRDITLDLTSEQGRDLVRRLVRRGRRRRGELLAAGDRAVRARLRVACGTEAECDPRAHARVRFARAVARIRRMGTQFRADIGHGRGHGLRGRSALHPAGTRRPDRRGARGRRAAGRARAPAPHRRRSAHRDRTDRGGGVPYGRAGHRVLDERDSPAAQRQSASRPRAGCLSDCVDDGVGGVVGARRRRLGATG